MGIPRFFRPVPYNRFDYKPLYYDPEKEQRELRNAAIKRELGMQDENQPYTPNIKGQMQRLIHHKRSEDKASNIRLVLILAMLFAITYWVLYS